MPSTGYVADTFVAGEQPTTAKWNELWGNDASFNSGNGFNDSILQTRHFATSGLQLPDKTLNPYKFSAYRSTNQTVTASTWTKVQFDTKLYDTGGNFDNSSNYQFTAPIDGYYSFEATVWGTAVASAGAITCGLNVGSFSSSPTYQAAGTAPGASGDQGSTITKNLHLTAGQTVQVYAYTTSTSLRGGAAPILTEFSGYLQSAT